MDKKLTFTSNIREIAGRAENSLQYDAYKVYLTTNDAALCINHKSGSQWSTTR